MSLSNSVDPYEWNVTSTQVTSNFRHNGTHTFGLVPEEELELNVVAADTARNDVQVTTSAPAHEGTQEGLPWSVDASLSYTKSGQGDPRSNLNLSGSLNVTRAWRIQYNTSYDIQGRIQSGYNFSVFRDLHCWEMSFVRRQLADRWEFLFEIHLKAHPEIKIDQGDRGLGGGGFFAQSPF